MLDAAAYLKLIKNSSADAPLNFAVGGTATMPALWFDKRREAKWCYNQLREKLKKDKAKQDSALFNYGTVAVEGAVVAVRCTVDPKTSLPKMFLKYFKDNAAPLTYKVRVFGPEGQELAYDEDEAAVASAAESSSSAAASSASDEQTFQEIKGEYKERCAALLNELMPLAGRSLQDLAWTADQRQRFSTILTEANTFWNGGKTGVYDRCWGALEAARDLRDQFDGAAADRRALWGRWSELEKRIGALRAGTPRQQLTEELGTLRTLAETVGDPGEAADRYLALEGRTDAIQQQITQCEATLKTLTPLAGRSLQDLGWTAAQRQRFVAALDQVSASLNNNPNGDYAACVTDLAAIGTMRDGANRFAADRRGLSFDLPALEKMIGAIPKGADSQQFKERAAAIRRDIESADDLDDTNSRYAELATAVTGLRKALDESAASVKELAPLVKQGPAKRDWMPGDYEELKAKYEEAARLYGAGEMTSYTTAMREALAIVEKADDGAVVRRGISEQLSRCADRIKALGRTPQALEFQATWRQIQDQMRRSRDLTGVQAQMTALQVAINQQEMPDRDRIEAARLQATTLAVAKREAIKALVEDNGVRQALDRVTQMLKGRNPDIPDQAVARLPEVVALQQVIAGMRSAILDATQEGEIGQFLALARREYDEALTGLQTMVADPAHIDDSLQRAQRAGEDLQRRAEWEKACATLDTQLRNLYEAGVHDYDEIEGEINRYKSVYAQSEDYAAALAEIPTFQERLGAAQLRHVNVGEPAIDGVRTAVKAFAEEVDAARDKFTKLEFGTDVLKAIDDQVALARKLLRADGNPQAAEGARMLIEQARRLFGDIDGVKGTAQKFFDAKAATAGYLDDAVVTQLQPQMNKDQRERFEKLTSDPDLLDLDDVTDALLTLGREVLATTQRAHDLQKLRDEFRGDSKAFKADIKALDARLKKEPRALGRIAGYNGTLVDDIAEMDTLVEDETLDIAGFRQRFAAMRATLDSFRQETPDGRLQNIGAIGRDGDAAQAKRDENSRQKEAQQKDSLDTRKGIDQFLSECREARKTLVAQLEKDGKTGKDFNDQDYQGLVQLAEHARKAVDSDLGAAKAEWAEAVKRLDRLKKQPEQLTVRSKAEVGRLAAKWATAIGAVTNNLVALANAARDQLANRVTERDQMPVLKDDIDMLEHTLVGLAAPLDRTAFDVSLATIASDRYDLKQRKQAREDALRLVRFYRDYLFGNPLVRHAQANPFGVGGVFTPLFEVLESLDLNVQRAVEVA